MINHIRAPKNWWTKWSTWRWCHWHKRTRNRDSWRGHHPNARRRHHHTAWRRHHALLKERCRLRGLFNDDIGRGLLRRSRRRQEGGRLVLLRRQSRGVATARRRVRIYRFWSAAASTSTSTATAAATWTSRPATAGNILYINWAPIFRIISVKKSQMCLGFSYLEEEALRHKLDQDSHNQAAVGRVEWGCLDDFRDGTPGAFADLGCAIFPY